jgi:predicted nucleotidyltransferase
MLSGKRFLYAGCSGTSEYRSPIPDPEGSAAPILNRRPVQSHPGTHRGIGHMDKTAAIESVKKYADRVRRDFNVKKVILFGSYARGTAREDSDIDVAVVFEKIDGDYLDVITRLSRIRRDVEHRIEPVALEELNDKSGFLKEIIKSGEIIYTSEKAIC